MCGGCCELLTLDAMDGEFVRPADKPRPPLITPSASPPVSRIRDRPPAAKRPRLSATPSTSSSVQRSSSLATISDAERLRLESLDRLFKTWDQLADRYHKPLDEDDIVDLRDLSIFKDRGVTRGIARTYAIGSMIVPTDEASSQAGDDDNVGEDDEEESADELDLISDPQVPPVPEEYKTWFVPPADQANPDDAEMFREFEEAEKKMRERYGVEGDDEDEAALDPGPDVESEPPLEEDEKEEDQEEAPSPPSPKSISQRRTSRPPLRTPGDDLSEDEFATWDFDETPVPPHRPVPPPVDDDIIDLTESPTPSPQRSIPLRRGRSKSRPPQSQNRARSKSKPPVHVEKRVNTPEIEQCPANEPVLQLFTPPRSSSAPESIPVPTIHDHEPALSPPPPAETPSPKFPKPRARYTPRPRTPSDDEEEEIPLPPPLLNLPLKVGPPRGVKKQTSSKTKGLKPEVVITLPPKKLRSKTRSARPASPEPPSSPSPQASKNKKSKGKEKEVPETQLSVKSGPQTSRRRRSQSQPRFSTRESDSPQPPPPTRGTKRRRVSSLSSLSDSSPARPVTPDPVSVPLSAVRNKRLTRSGSSRSGYSSDIPPPTSSPVLSDAEDGGSQRLFSFITMLKRSLQTTKVLGAPVAVMYARLALRPTCHPIHTRLPCSLTMPLDMIITRQRVPTVISLTNDTRHPSLPLRLRRYRTRRRSSCSRMHGTACLIWWHPGRSQHLLPRVAATRQVYHSRLRPGHPTHRAINDTAPIHSTRLRSRRKRVRPARPRIPLRRTTRIRTPTRTIPRSQTAHSRPLRPSPPHLRLRRRRCVPPPYLRDSGAARGADASRSSWTSTIGRSRLLPIPETHPNEPALRVRQK